jgi:hypothetical protein
VASDDFDFDYKLKTSAAFRRMGYTVFQEVDLATFSYQGKYQRKQVSDFDVLGVLIEPDFSIITAVAECKTVEDQSMDFLMKLIGLRQFFRADKAYLVQKRIDVNTREVARESAISCLDDGNLTTLLHGLEISGEQIALDRSLYLIKEKVSKALKTDQKKAFQYLKFDYWTLPPHRNVINLLRQFSLLAEKVDASLHQDRVLALLMATSLGLAISRITQEVIRQDIDSPADIIRNRIAGGVRERRDKEALFDTVARLIPDSRLHKEPPFIGGLSELIARFINALRASSSVVACLDHLTRSEICEDFAKVAGRAEDVYGERALKLAHDLLHFISAETKIPFKVFKGALDKH